MKAPSMAGAKIQENMDVGVIPSVSIIFKLCEAQYSDLFLDSDARTADWIEPTD